MKRIPEAVRALQAEALAWLYSDRVPTPEERAAYQHAIATYARTGTAPVVQPELELPCA